MNIAKEIELASGLTVPRIITGLWQIADMERGGEDLDPQVAAQYMDDYVKEGFYAFDMADHYGSSEIITGHYRNNFELGSQAKLFTKWVPTPGKISKEQVEQAVNTALDRMQISSIDLMQFHAWQYAEAGWLDGLFHLHELQKQGRIHHIGVTNFDAAHLRIALQSGIPIVSNQICHSLFDQRALGSMTALCKEFGIKILAFGTLAGGFLTDKWLNKPEPKMEDLSTWSQMKYKRFIDEAGGWEVFQNLLSVAREVADNNDVSIANIATRYILENDAVASVIIGARLGERNHIPENKKLLEIELSARDIEIIKEAQSHLQPIPGNCGDEYRKEPFLTASGDLSHHLENFPPIFEKVQCINGSYKVYSGTSWEEQASYCRAVRAGDRIHVSGTTSTHGPMAIGGRDPIAQTHFVIDKIEAAILSLGGTLEDVVRTRVFITHIDDWSDVANVHGERFRGIDPANTLVQANLIGDDYLVEIEAEAVVSP